MFIAAAAVWVSSLCIFTDGASLRGTVADPAGPIAGARVMVSRAWPREGPAYLCSGCYRDCGRTAVTGPDGSWTIDGLDEALRFQLLVAAPEHLAHRTKAINPAKQAGAALDLRLTPRAIASLDAAQVVRGRILGPDGRPVEKASVEAAGVWTDNFKGGHFGEVDGLDPLSVTDADGRFALAYDKPCDGMGLEVTAPGLARQCFNRVRSGPEPTDLAMTEGGSVTGRIMRDGRAVRGVTIGLCPLSRDSMACFARESIATDDEGRFTFANVPPRGEYVVYFVHDAPPPPPGTPGTLRITRATVEYDRQDADLGTLQLIDGFRVSGAIRTAAGEPPPPGTHIGVSHDEAWSSPITAADAEGRFTLEHVPPGEYKLWAAATGHHLAAPPSGPKKIDIQADLNNVKLVLADGPQPEPAGPPPRKPIGELGGAESPAPLGALADAPIAHIPERADLHGRVTMDGRPVAGAVVRPRSAGSLIGTTYETKVGELAQIATTDAAGRFTLTGLRKEFSYALLAAAPGIDPSRVWMVTPDKEPEMTLDPAATKPSSSSLTANALVSIVDESGRPLPGAVVDAIQVQYGMGSMMGPAAGGVLAVSESNGAARLHASVENHNPRQPATIEGFDLRISVPGFAIRRTTGVRTNVRTPTVIRLERGGTVTGVVRDARGRPLAAVDLAAMPASARDWPSAWDARSATTDAEGRFTIEHVPSGEKLLLSPWAGALPEGECCPITDVAPLGPGETRSIPDVVTTAGFVVAGTVETVAGKGLPAGTWIQLEHNNTLLTWSIQLDQHNGFRFPAAPSGGPYTLTCCDTSYRVSPDNLAAREGNYCAIEGLLTRDHPNIALRLIPRDGR